MQRKYVQRVKFVQCVEYVQSVMYVPFQTNTVAGVTRMNTSSELRDAASSFTWAPERKENRQSYVDNYDDDGDEDRAVVMMMIMERNILSGEGCRLRLRLTACE